MCEAPSRHGSRRHRCLGIVSHHQLCHEQDLRARLRGCLCARLQRFIAEVCKESPRLKAVALLPFQDVDAAVKEVNRAVTELGLVGVAVAPQGMREHLGSQTFWRSMRDPTAQCALLRAQPARRAGGRDSLRQFHLYAYDRPSDGDHHPVRRLMYAASRKSSPSYGLRFSNAAPAGFLTGWSA